MEKEKKIKELTTIPGYGYRYLILAGISLAYFYQTVYRYGMTPITKQLQADLNLTMGQIGVLGSAFFYAYAFANLLWGYVVDKIGIRKTFTISVALLTIIATSFGFSPNYTIALLIRVLQGVAAAGIYVPGARAASAWFTKAERGRAVGLFNSIGGLGQAFIQIALPVLIVSGFSFGPLTGWRAGWVVLSLPAICIVIFDWLVLRDKTEDKGLPPISEIDKRFMEAEVLRGRAEEKFVEMVSRPEVEIWDVIKSPFLWALCLAWVGYIASVRVGNFWAARYALDAYGVGLITAGAAGSLFAWGRFIGGPMSGWVADLTKYRWKIIAAGLIGMGVVIELFTVKLGIAFLSLMVFFMGIFLGFYVNVNAMPAEVWGVKTAGRANGIINFCGQIAGAVFLSLSGYIQEWYGWSAVWHLCLAVALLGVLGALYARTTEMELKR